jgi:transcriptional regulator with PAS, ATPase and Fis domain
MGPRKNNPFVTINCSAIPETLMETEFFGHEKGAFTGADSRKIGKFQYADGGTLFLDEIGDITPAMQVKLLRAIQERTFTPVGSNREVEVDVRILAATNRNLEEMIANGTFREDLFYRLNVLPITLPPLRERPDDIEILVGHFIATFNQEHQKNIKGLAPGVLQILKDHRWPGNIRELENVIEHAFVMEPSELITAESLPETVIEGAAEAPDEAGTSTATKAEPVIAGEILPGARGFSLDVERLDYHLAKEEFEKQFLISALKAFKGRINQTALHANIPKKTLLRKLLKYGIRARDYSGG